MVVFVYVKLNVPGGCLSQFESSNLQSVYPMIEPIWCRINLLGLYAFERARVVCVNVYISSVQGRMAASLPAVTVCVVLQQSLVSNSMSC